MIYNILSYLEQHIPDRGQAVAFADKTNSMTYEALYHTARQVGSFLAHSVNKRRQPVFVVIGRNVESLAMCLGVVYSGNFYVPVDPSLPKERLLLMREAIQPCAVLGQSSDPLPYPDQDFPSISLEDSMREAPDDRLLLKIRRETKSTDPLYCVFTSGSTGIPKGVLASHGSVIDMVEQFTETFGFDSTCVFGNQSPFDYDGSVKDIYSSIKHGARMEILEKKLFSFPVLLMDRLNERGVNTLIWAASAMKIISTLHTFQERIPLHVRQVLFSGEVLSGKVLRDWRQALPRTSFCNLYGPTEITCNCTYYCVNRDFKDGEQIPIGQAFSNCTVYLITDEGRLANPGEIGEIVVSGVCLALGYYRQSEYTSAAFAQSPLHSDFPEQVYRTGDLGRYDPENHMLYFVGRRDTQIKHMGHRIELGEIEAAALSLPGIIDAACIHNKEKDKLFLFYIADPDIKGDISAAALLTALRQRLPKYMLPNRYEPMKAFPLTRTGKTDRKQLAAGIE